MTFPKLTINVDSDGAGPGLARPCLTAGDYLLSPDENWSFDANHIVVRLRRFKSLKTQRGFRVSTSVIKIIVKPGQEETFETIIKKLVAASNKNEPGIRFYQAFRCANPGEYWMLESFIDLDASKAHTSTDHFKALRAELGACFDRPPEIQRLSDL